MYFTYTHDQPGLAAGSSKAKTAHLGSSDLQHVGEE